MIAVVVSTMCYLYFVSYASTLTAFSVVSSSRWRLGSRVLSLVGGDIWLCTGSISCIVGDVACSISGGIGWRIGRSIGCGVGSGINRLHYFVFTSFLFRHWLKGSIAMTSLARMF
jgi:hypothetical protein